MGVTKRIILAGIATLYAVQDVTGSLIDLPEGSFNDDTLTNTIRDASYSDAQKGARAGPRKLLQVTPGPGPDNPVFPIFPDFQPNFGGGDGSIGGLDAFSDFLVPLLFQPRVIVPIPNLVPTSGFLNAWLQLLTGGLIPGVPCVSTPCPGFGEGGFLGGNAGGSSTPDGDAGAGAGAGGFIPTRGIGGFSAPQLPRPLLPGGGSIGNFMTVPGVIGTPQLPRPQFPAIFGGKNNGGGGDGVANASDGAGADDSANDFSTD